MEEEGCEALQARLPQHAHEVSVAADDHDEVAASVIAMGAHEVSERVDQVGVDGTLLPVARRHLHPAGQERLD